MLGEVISLVETAFFPHDVKPSLLDTISDPIKAHVNGFGSFLLNGIVGDAGSSAVAGNDDGWWLWVPKFL